MTTLETGIRGPRERSRAGFTLLEIIFVFALIALATGVILTNFNTFFDFGEAVDPEEVLRESMRAARFQAASEGQEAVLYFDRESSSMVLRSGESFALGENFGPDGQAAIRFFLVAPAEGLDSFPDATSTQLETTRIRFAPDGSSSPFVADIDTGGGRPERIVFDPFSGLVRCPQ